jgi:hypothetical protein
MLTLESLKGLLGRYELSRSERDPDLWKFSNTTPSHSFTTYLRLLRNGGLCLAVGARDFTDDALASEVAAFVAERETGLSDIAAITVFQAFNAEGYSFDSIGLLSPASAGRFQSISKELDRVTFVAFPMFRCEFSGDESSNLIKEMMHETVSTLDWKRPPSPAARIQFRNTQTGVRSPGENYHLVSLRTAMRHLTDMEGANGSYISVVNFAKSRARVDVEDDLFRLTSSENTETHSDRVGLSIARQWLADFLTGRIQDGRAGSE